MKILTIKAVLYLVLIFCKIFSSSEAYSQVKLSGVIIGSSKKGIQNASLRLEHDTSHKTFLTHADSVGRFIYNNILVGQYSLHLSHISIKDTIISISIQSDTVLVIQTNEQTDGIQLEEVAVTAQRPLLERKIDRVVFNIENSIATIGTDLSQALALAPLLRVDDNNVSIVGKSSLSVMINDRIINLSGADLVNYLKSLRSDDVSKIEVITAPPAKYDAQGNNGLINIVLKKNPNMGWSGNFGSTFTQTTYSGIANNAVLNYQSMRVNSSLKLRQYYGRTRPYEKIDVVGFNSILSDEDRIDTKQGLGVNLSLDYKLSNKSNLGFVYDLGNNVTKMDIDNIYTYQTNGAIDSLLTTSSFHDRPAISQMLNIYLDNKLNSNGAKLSSLANYFSTVPQNDLKFETYSDRSQRMSNVLNESKLNYKIWSIQTDLVYPTKFASFESGVKFTDFDNKSHVNYFNILGEKNLIDPTRSNQFDYSERNLAAYLGLTKKLNNKLSAKAGLRYEYIFTNGFSPESKERIKNEYGSIFPTFYLDYKFDDNNSINFNYARRINRPGFSALNPFRWYSNPYAYSTGNPQLSPSYNSNFELSYLFKSSLYITLYEHRLSNGFGRIVRIIDGATKKVEYQNYYRQTSRGVEASVRVKPLTWWDSNIFASVNYAIMRSEISEVVPKNGSAFYYSVFNTFKINKSIGLLLNYWHSLPSTQGNVISKSRSNLSSGVRLTLLENKLLFNISVDDIFKGTIGQGEIVYADYVQYSNNYYDSRRINLNITYLFGNNKVKGNQKKVDFNETNRTN